MGDCSGATACSLDLTGHKAVTAAFTRQQFALTTATAGTGHGTVTGAGTYAYGTQVTVTESAATGSTFTGWSGACSNMGPCVVTMTQARSVTATFTAIPETLTVTAGAGGKIVSTPAGVSCGATPCAHDFDYGTPVKLTAVPDAGHVLAVWAGDCSGTSTTSPCSLTMDQAHSVTVRFAPVQYTLDLTFPGDAPGTVTVNGTTYNSATSIPVAYGDQVTLTEAVPVGTASRFWTWGGACSSNAMSCTITVSGDTSVSATFLQNTYRYTLTATTLNPNFYPFQVTYPPSTTSSAECTSSAAGQNCSGSLPVGTVVTLVAHLPANGAFQPAWNTLPSWSGCDSVSADRMTCTFTNTSMHVIRVSGDVRAAP